MSDSENNIMPKQVKFVAMPVFTEEGGFCKDNPDGWVCGEEEELDGLVELAVNYAEAHGGVTYIYECRLVRKIYRGKTRVEHIKAVR